MQNDSILKVNDLAHSFYDGGKKDFEVVKNISFSVNKGEFLSVVGPSGGGKSTLLRIITGLIKPTHGSVEINTRKIAMVFQNFAVFPWLTVHDNVGFGLKMSGVSKKEQEAIIAEKIKEVGLTGFDKKYPKELSGGMRQRVGLARALAVNPELLIMDEPFSSLDTFTAEKLRLDLLDIWNKYKMTIVMVTHLVEEALVLSDRVIIVSKRPASIKETLDVNLDRPRNTRAEHFFSLLDKITSQIES